MTTIEQTRFSPAKASSDGRGFTSTLVLEHTRTEANEYIDMQVSTSHKPGRGYTASVTRSSVSDFGRTMCLSFGEQSDLVHPDVSAHRPTSTRYSNKNAEQFHTAVVAQIESNLDYWIKWTNSKRITN